MHAFVLKDCLTRPLSESVRIDCRTEVLNSKSVYSRNRLPRLILETPEWEKKTEDNRRSQDKTRENEEITEAEMVEIFDQYCGDNQKRKHEESVQPGGIYGRVTGENSDSMRTNKRRKTRGRRDEEKKDWGENLPEGWKEGEEDVMRRWLEEPPEKLTEKKLKQKVLKPVKMVDLMAMDIINEVVAGAAGWKEKMTRELLTEVLEKELEKSDWKEQISEEIRNLSDTAVEYAEGRRDLMGGILEEVTEEAMRRTSLKEEEQARQKEDKRRKVKQLGLQECWERKRKLVEEKESVRKKQREKARLEKIKWLENHHRMDWETTELRDTAQGGTRETGREWRLQPLVEGKKKRKRNKKEKWTRRMDQEDTEVRRIFRLGGRRTAEGKESLQRKVRIWKANWKKKDFLEKQEVKKRNNQEGREVSSLEEQFITSDNYNQTDRHVAQGGAMLLMPNLGTSAVLGGVAAEVQGTTNHGGPQQLEKQQGKPDFEKVLTRFDLGILGGSKVSNNETGPEEAATKTVLDPKGGTKIKVGILKEIFETGKSSPRVVKRGKRRKNSTGDGMAQSNIRKFLTIFEGKIEQNYGGRKRKISGISGELSRSIKKKENTTKF